MTLAKTSAAGPMCLATDSQGLRTPVACREKAPDWIELGLVVEPAPTAEVRFIELTEEAPVGMPSTRPNLLEYVQMVKKPPVSEEFFGVRERVELEAALLDDLGRQLG